MYETQLESYK